MRDHNSPPLGVISIHYPLLDLYRNWNQRVPRRCHPYRTHPYKEGCGILTNDECGSTSARDAPCNSFKSMQIRHDSTPTRLFPRNGVATQPCNLFKSTRIRHDSTRNAAYSAGASLYRISVYIFMELVRYPMDVCD